MFRVNARFHLTGVNQNLLTCAVVAGNLVDNFATILICSNSYQNSPSDSDHFLFWKLSC